MIGVYILCLSSSNQNLPLYLLFPRLTLCWVFILEILFLHQPFIVNRPPKNKPKVRILNQIKVSPLQVKHILPESKLPAIKEIPMNIG